MRLFLFVVIRALTACLLGSSAAAQPLTHQDDLNIDDIPDRLEFELVENPDGMDSQRVKVVDGDTNELIYIFEPPVLHGDGFGADARIGADWTGDGIAEIYISVPLVERWGGYGVVWVYDGVGFDRVLKFDGNVSDIFGLEINEIPDTDGDGWDELVFSSHFIDTDLDVWQEWLELPKGDLGVNPIAEDDPTLFLRGADVDENGIVDLEDLADISSQVGSDDPALDLDTDGTVDAADVTVAAGAWQGGTPVVPNGRLLFWAPDADTGVGTTGEIILKRSTDGGLGGGGSGGGGGGTNGGGGGGGGGGGDDDDDDGGGGGGGGGGGDDDDDDDGDDDDEDEDETKPRCLFDNPENWIDRESTTNENCVLVLIGQALGKYSAIFPGNGPTRLTFGAVTSELGSAISWSVSGATVEGISFADNYGFSRCTILIENPGTVTISANVASPCGGLYVHGKTRVIELDLDVDSDNDDSLDSPERDEDEELAEFAHWPTDDTPGKVALTNIFDYDGDGLPGYIDGINMFDTVDITDDDEGGEEMLVPLVFDVDGPVCEEAAVRFFYQAAKPPIGTSDSLFGYERAYEDGERVRLWANRGPSRDPRTINDGGDYIPPGVWIPLSEFGMVQIDSSGIASVAESVTLWVELVMPSVFTGDAIIKAELAPGVEGSTWPRDAVRFTATEVVLLGVNASEEEHETAVLVRSVIPDSGIPSFEAQGTGPWMSHRVRILDPRPSAYISNLSMESHELPLHPVDDGVYETEDFVIPDYRRQVTQPPLQQMLGLPNGVRNVDLYYNPSWSWGLVEEPDPPALGPPDDLLEDLQRNADGVSLEMKNEGWAPRNVNNGGSEFGIEVDRRLALRYQGHANIRYGMLVDPETGIVRQLDGATGSVPGRVQLDAVICKPGYTPQIGQPLDVTKCWYADVKISAGGSRLVGDQARRIRDIFPNERVMLVRPKWRWDQRMQNWIINPKWKAVARVLGFLGFGSAVLATIHPHSGDALLEDWVALHEGILAAGNDQAELTLAMQDIGPVIIRWFDTFTGGGIGAAFLYPKLIDMYSGQSDEE